MPLQVSDVMNRRVVSIGPDAAVTDALRLMLDERISGLPVVAADGVVAGILTEGDFLRRSEIGTEPHHGRWLEFLIGPGRLANEYVDTHGRKVAEVMSTRVVGVTETMPLSEAVGLMEQHRVKRLPVLREGRLVGILSRADLLRAFVTAADESNCDTSDEGIRRRIADEIRRQAWSPQSMITVVVAGGEVHLHGVLFDDRLRAALQVLVENVPGVSKIHDHLATVEPMSGFVVQAPAE